MSRRKSSPLPRRLADEILQSLDEISRWARGEKTGVRVRVFEVPPRTIRKARINLPGGGVVSVSPPLDPADAVAIRRKIARIRRAVLKTVAEDEASGGRKSPGA